MSAAAAEKGCATVVFGKKCLCNGFIADKWKPITCKGCMHTKNDHYGIEKAETVASPRPVPAGAQKKEETAASATNSAPTDPSAEPIGATCVQVNFGQKCKCEGFQVDRWKKDSCKLCTHAARSHTGPPAESSVRDFTAPKRTETDRKIDAHVGEPDDDKARQQKEADEKAEKEKEEKARKEREEKDRREKEEKQKKDKDAADKRAKDKKEQEEKEKRDKAEEERKEKEKKDEEQKAKAKKDEQEAQERKQQEDLKNQRAKMREEKEKRAKDEEDRARVAEEDRLKMLKMNAEREQSFKANEATEPEKPKEDGTKETPKVPANRKLKVKSPPPVQHEKITLDKKKKKQTKPEPAEPERPRSIVDTVKESDRVERKSSAGTRLLLDTQSPEEIVAQFLKSEIELKEFITKATGTELLAKAEPGKLTEVLKDGVLLCELMLVLDPRSIPRFSTRPANIMVKRENVFYFIEAAIEYGVPKQRLFSPADLVLGKNPLRVLQGLEQLAVTAEERHDFAVKLERKDDAEFEFAADLIEETLKNFNELRVIARKPSRPERRQKGATNSLSVSQMTEESQIILKLAPRIGVSEEKELLAILIKCQAYIRGALARLSYEKIRRNVVFRDHVAREITDTEQVYCDNLGVLVDLYVKPLTEMEGKRALLTSDQLRVMFPDIATILGSNKVLLEKLRARQEDWSPHGCVGDLFLEQAPTLKMYSSYIKGYDQAESLRVELEEKKPKFVKFLEAQKTNPRSKLLSLSMLQILPIQRIPRYQLLLTELMKHTWPGHPDYNNLEKALLAIKDVATYVNEEKRKYENMAAVREVQTLFVKQKKAPSLIEASRTFIRHDLGKEGTDREKGKNLVLFLFNDMLLVSEMGTGSSKKKMGGTLPAVAAGSLKANDLAWLGVKYREHWALDRVVVRPPQLRKWAKKTIISRGTKDKELASTVQPFSNKNTVDIARRNEDGTPGEVVLKARLESALHYASFVAEFNKAASSYTERQEELDRAAMERSKSKTAAAKAEAESRYKGGKTTTMTRRQWAERKNSQGTQDSRDSRDSSERE